MFRFNTSEVDVDGSEAQRTYREANEWLSMQTDQDKYVWRVANGFQELERMSDEEWSETVEGYRGAEVEELKRRLRDTDYVDNKILEAWLLGGDEAKARMVTEYSSVLAEREAWRARINELEEMIG